MQKITTFLWYNDNAEEAVNHYMSLFKNSKIINASRYGDAGPGPKGSLMVCTFELDGQRFMAMNGGPMYQFTPAISLCVDCKTQEEVDALWDGLSEGGATNRCGWLTDKFGLSWQIVPSVLGEIMQGKGGGNTSKAMMAMMKMTKLNIAELQAAYES